MAFEIKRYLNRYVKMPFKQVSLSIRAPFGNLKGISFSGLLEKQG
jgi:hypothetical protein